MQIMGLRRLRDQQASGEWYALAEQKYGTKPEAARAREQFVKCQSRRLARAEAAVRSFTQGIPASDVAQPSARARKATAVASPSSPVPAPAPATPSTSCLDAGDDDTEALRLMVEAAELLGEDVQALL